MLLLKNYLKSLQELIEKYPEASEYPIIYSHDDEGNEYQRVINEPTLCQLEDPNQKSYRFLELVGFHDGNDILREDCNAVIIN